MASSEPFLHLGSGDIVCALCNAVVILRSEQKYKKAVKYKKDLSTLKRYAEKWRDLDIPSTDPLASFSSAFSRLNGRAEGYFHDNCLTNIRLKHSTYASRYKTKVSCNEPLQVDVQQPSPSISAVITSPNYCTRSSLTSPTEKQQCFICYQDSIEKTFRISQASVAEKVHRAKSLHLNKYNSLYFTAAKRLDIMLQGDSLDIFAADVFYHNMCLQDFTYIRKEYEDDPTEQFVLDYFCSYINLKICQQKNAYLLHELLNDSNNMCEEHGIAKIFTRTKSLRRYLEQHVENVSFTQSRKFVVVYSSDIDPVMYSNSTLNGHGLRKTDIIRSFAKMIQRVADAYGDLDHIEFPAAIDDLISGLKNDSPIVELYNAIYMTINKQWKSSVRLNEHGLAMIESKNLAAKIWSLACDWTALLTGLKNSKQISLVLDVHRLTANKEVGILL